MKRIRRAGPLRSIVVACSLVWALSGTSCRDRESAELPPLFAAILTEDDARTRALIEAGADLVSPFRVTSATLAAYGLDATLDRAHVVTPIQFAAYLGRARAVRLLLESGVDPNVRNGEVSPLAAAFDKGDSETILVLLAHGASPDIRLPNGRSALAQAVAERDYRVLAALLDAGVEPTLAGSNLMRFAATTGDVELIAFLARKGESLADADPLLDGGAIDTHGFLPTAAEQDTTASDEAWPRGIAVDADHGWIYWTEFGRNRIRRTSRRGDTVETVVEAAGDGPIGLAIDVASARLFWTTDGSYPRSVRVAGIDGGTRDVLALGPMLNRPRAIAVGADSLIWTELINGVIRRASTSGGSVATIVDDGIANRFEQGRPVPLFYLGVASDVANDRLYLSDFYGSRIESMHVDGSRRETVAGPEQGVDFPTGIAVDGESERLLWADAGREAIVEWKLGESASSILVDADDGLVNPRGVAVDVRDERVYWTDAARNAIGRAKLDGSGVEWLELDHASEHGFARLSPGPGDCRAAVDHAVDEFRLYAAKSLALCLEKVDAVKAVKRVDEAAQAAVATCSGQLSAIAPGGRHAFARTLGTAVDRRCSGQAPEATSLLVRCGADPSDCETVECAATRCRRAVWREVGRRQPRAAEWLAEVRPFLLAASGEGSPVAELTREIASEIEPTPSRSTNAVLPATGMRTSYRAILADTSRPVAVPDDAAVAAGAPLRFLDNADGTITDLSTGLMWEKKCGECQGPHRTSALFSLEAKRGATSVAEWLDGLNREGGTGFAGYDDWRLPDVEELQSIVDYERFNPAVPPVFDAPQCGISCSDVRDSACSCTALNAYWTSTTVVANPERAFVIGFNLGLVGDLGKREEAMARAVRNGADRPL